MPGFGQGQISKPSLKAMMDNFQLQWTLPFQFLQLQSKVTWDQLNPGKRPSTELLVRWELFAQKMWLVISKIDVQVKQLIRKSLYYYNVHI